MAVDTGAIRALTRFQDLDDVPASGGDGIWTRQGGTPQWIGINSFLSMAPNSSGRNVIQATAGYDALTIKTAVAGSFISGSHYVMPAGAQAIRINQHGDIFFGESYLVTEPNGITGRQNVWTGYSQQSDRWFLRGGLGITMIADPPDINFRRYGPENGYPWGLPGNAIGSYANLTAVDANTPIGQIKATVIVAPYGGDHTTQGAKDQGEGFTVINWKTSELGRDVTGNQDDTGGCTLGFSIVPTGSVSAWDLVNWNAASVQIGGGSISSGNNGDLLQLRPFAGRNEVKTISKTNNPTSGTWKIGVWSVSPDTTGKAPLDGSSYATQVKTAAIPWNAAASDVQTALDALLGASQVVVTGGPLPGSTITLTYSGSNVKNTHMLKLLIDNTSLVGGTYGSTRVTEGRPWGAGGRILFMRHTAGSDGVNPDNDYVLIQNPSGTGTDVLRINNLGVLFSLGQAVVLTNDARLTPTSLSPVNASTSVTIINAKVTGDTQSRFLLRTGGTQEWGSGAAATDLEWARQNTGQIRLRGFGPATFTQLIIQMVESALSGTLTATNGSAAVVGAGTSFTSELNEGTFIRIENTPGSGTYTDYTVSSITDSNHLTLTANFTGATNSGLAGRTRTQGPTGTDILALNDANGHTMARVSASGTIRSVVALGTRHEAAATPTQGISGDIRMGTGKLWINDAGTWIYIPASGFIAGTDLVANTITATQLANSAVGTNQLAAVSVTAAKIANNTITATQIAAATITDNEVAAANKDGVVGTASLRTLGTGAQQAAPGNDARFTRLIAYAQRTTGVNITATTSATATDAGLDTGTVAYDGTDILITFFAPQLQRGTSSITVVLYDGATELGKMGAMTSATGANFMRCKLTPSVGNHDYKIKAYVDAGTGQITGGDGTIGNFFPAYIRIEKAA